MLDQVFSSRSHKCVLHKLTYWLLFPCSIDADPDAVAKYTVALVRKGPDTEEEFKPSICENLSVFLTESKIIYLVSGLV